MDIERKKYQGVLNILSFNRHFYYWGLSILTIFVISRLYFDWNATIFWMLIFLFTYGLIMPLIISAYVYDFSKYYDLKWVDDLGITQNKSSHLNINAGFDETSHLLNEKFPNANLQVFDFYNPKNHTEKAIIRARKTSQIFPGTVRIKSNSLPIKGDNIDTIFLLSAIHEIRSNKEKVTFLKECKRILAPYGKIIIVEHLRDLPNFLAFSVGFTHFFSKKTWITCFKSAGFKQITENKFTPFMSVFTISN